MKGKVIFMKKNLCAFALACSLLAAAVLSSFSAATVAAVEKSAGIGEQKIIEIVGALEIMQGDENGNLNLENSVTRAEFVKMAVSASSFKDDADVKTAYSVFPDVGAHHWAAGYIRTAVDAGWINGYLDGTFMPSGKVKLEEAANIVLKLLGYTNADFIGSYPDGQLAKYRSLKLDTGISASAGDELTRRECMYLIYNMLCTYTKNGSPYCASIGAAADADGNIDYSALVEDKKEGPYIVTDASAWKSDIAANDGFIYYKDGKVISADEVKVYDVLYYSDEFSTVWVYDDKTAGILESYAPDKKSPKSVTVSGVAYALAPRSDYEGRLSEGSFAEDESVVLLLGENGCAVEAFEADAPIVIESEKELSSDISKIYRGDSYSEGNTVGDKSLAYVCKELSSAFVYDKGVSGIVTALLPSKENPTAVMLGSKSYNLGSNVKDLFKNEKAFAENDFITVYTGKSGNVEYAEKADIYDTDIYEDNGLSYDALVAATLKGPEIVKGDAWKSKIGFSADEAQYFRDGKQVLQSSLKDYDVIYYSPTFKAVWVYSDKVTGVLESISPSTVAPSAVTVGGSSYSLETSQAVIAFAGKGKFAVGDTVTLLMGAQGAAAAVEPSEVSNEFLGISTDVSKKEYVGSDGKTHSDYYVTVASFDGKTHSIKTENRDFDTGVLVIVSYSDENDEITVKEYSLRYTDISELKSVIKSGKISADAVLVDYYGKSFVKTYPARLSEIEIEAKNVAYYNINSDGYLDYLVLKDATGDGHAYGVIFNYKGVYNFITSMQNGGIANYVIPPTGAVQIKYNNGEAESITALKEVSVTSIDGASVKYVGKSSKLWDYAECFVLEQKSYSTSRDSDDKLSEVISKTSVDYIKTLLSGDEYTVKGYCDSTGTVRVLVAQRKL